MAEINAAKPGSVPPNVTAYLADAQTLVTGLSAATPAATGASTLQQIDADISNVLSAVQPVAATVYPAAGVAIEAAEVVLPGIEAWVNPIITVQKPQASRLWGLPGVGGGVEANARKKALPIPGGGVMSDTPDLQTSKARACEFVDLWAATLKRQINESRDAGRTGCDRSARIQQDAGFVGGIMSDFRKSVRSWRIARKCRIRLLFEEAAVIMRDARERLEALEHHVGTTSRLGGTGV